MAWYTHPHLEGDGEICIAGPNGPIRCTVTSGVFEWPEEAGAPHSSFVPTEPPPAAIEAKRRADLERLKAEAARLGVQIAEAEDEPAEEPESPADEPAEQGAIITAGSAYRRSGGSQGGSRGRRGRR